MKKIYRRILKNIFFFAIYHFQSSHFKLYPGTYLLVFHFICQFLIIFVSFVLIKGSNVVIFVHVFITQIDIICLYYRKHNKQQNLIILYFFIKNLKPFSNKKIRSINRYLKSTVGCLRRPPTISFVDATTSFLCLRYSGN